MIILCHLVWNDESIHLKTVKFYIELVMFRRDSWQWPVCISSQQHHPHLQDLHHGPGRVYTSRHAFGKVVSVHARKDVWLWLSPECGAACFAANLISHDLITGDLFTETLAGPQLSEFLEWRDCKSYFLPELGWSQEGKGKLPCFSLSPIAILLAKLLRVNLFFLPKESSAIILHELKHWKISFFKTFECLWTLIQ